MSERFPQNDIEGSEDQEQIVPPLEHQEEGIPDVDKAGKLTPKQEEELGRTLREVLEKK